MKLRPTEFFRRAGIVAALAALAACAASARAGPVGLLTSLPILWSETESLGDLLKPQSARHWALEVLEGQEKVRPVDSLLPVQGKDPLAGLGLLVMAQPRALAPQENVALDRWVRKGGHLLLFADPMLTAQSAYAFGDRRRPESMVMLSPILARWGLVLEFDAEQPAGRRDVDLLGSKIPVDLPGRLAARGGKARCALLAQGLAASCRIGKGGALIVADAALFEPAPAEQIAERSAALHRLIDAARRGDSAPGK